MPQGVGVAGVEGRAPDPGGAGGTGPRGRPAGGLHRPRAVGVGHADVVHPDRLGQVTDRPSPHGTGTAEHERAHPTPRTAVHVTGPPAGHCHSPPPRPRPPAPPPPSPGHQPAIAKARPASASPARVHAAPPTVRAACQLTPRPRRAPASKPVIPACTDRDVLYEVVSRAGAGRPAVYSCAIARLCPGTDSEPLGGLVTTTVGDLLAIEELSLRLVAGAAGVDRPIRWAHVSELDDPTCWLRGGEGLLTTGLGIGQDARAQARYVDQLARAKLAGLGLGLGFAFDQTPAA